MLALFVRFGARAAVFSALILVGCASEPQLISKSPTVPEGVDLTITTALSELTSDSVAGIRFFPDGGSTGGHIELTVNGREYRIDVAWLTGEARLQRLEG